MLIMLFYLDGITEVARPRPYRRGLRSCLINTRPALTGSIFKMDMLEDPMVAVVDSTESREA